MRLARAVDRERSSSSDCTLGTDRFTSAGEWRGDNSSDRADTLSLIPSGKSWLGFMLGDRVMAMIVSSSEDERVTRSGGGGESGGLGDKQQLLERRV